MSGMAPDEPAGLALAGAVALAAEATQRPLGGRILSWMESQEKQGKTPCIG